MGMNISGKQLGMETLFWGRMGMGTNIHPRAAVYFTVCWCVCIYGCL